MIQLKFYKAEYGSWYDKGIAWWTKGPYSHVEIVFSKDGMWFSSSPRDGGVRYKYIEDSFHWDTVQVECTLAEEIKLRNICNTYVGQKYDWLFCFGFVVPPLDDPKKKKACSEVVNFALYKWGRLKHRIRRISPNGLYRYLKGEMYQVT